LRWGGFAPALSDEEVITMEVCGEYFKLSTDKDLFTYFRTQYAHFFPRLRERTLFVRQVANWSKRAQTIPVLLECTVVVMKASRENWPDALTRQTALFASLTRPISTHDWA